MAPMARQLIALPENDEENNFLITRQLSRPGRSSSRYNASQVLSPRFREEVRSLVITADTDNEECDAELHHSLQNIKVKWGAAKLFLAGACCAVFFGVCFVSLQGESPPQVKPALQVHEVVMFQASDGESGSESSDKLPKCLGEGDTHWRQLALGDARIPTALNMSFKLASLKRLKCEPAEGPLDWDPAVFILDKYRDKTVEVMHKFSTDCSGETFMSHFQVMGNPETTFNIEVHYNRGTHLWTLLNTDPGECWLLAGPGTSAAPRMVSPASAVVKNAAAFAIAEINFRARESNCLNGNQAVSLGAIHSANVVMKIGLMYTISCQLKYSSYSYAATLTVVQRCGGSSQCFYQLELPDDRKSSIHPESPNTPWCDPLSFSGKEGGFNATGLIDEDRTNNFVTQRVLLYDRELSGSEREPLMERYIQVGEVPEMHDPREDDCFIKSAVYNQGFCNAGYANAWAGMMGVRKCMYAKKSRRLQVKQSSHDERQLEEVKKQCSDDENWSAFGKGTYDCSYFKQKGCSGVDYGQFTHCRLTCDSCPKSVEMGGTDPWALADYKFIPSVEDLASCSVSPSGQASGCSGGNMWEMWDNNLAKSKRPMWVSGHDCKPYTLKCWKENHLVNPLSDGLCWTYEGYELWHKPCSCIPIDKRPTKLPQCDTDPPKGACEFVVPAAAFVVRGMSSGLTSAEAVLNYQRHILEAGPLYVPVMTTMDFFNWDWEKHPVYTGGGVIAGGTAMMILGWGGGGYSYVETPFWILRNSWGADWREKGTCLWLRGENLQGIENQAGVTMSGADYHDWSAPICRMTSWSRKWTTDGEYLTNYTMKIKVRCSEDCDVKAFFSNGQANGHVAMKAGWHATGIVREFNGKKHEDVEAPEISLHLRGYGVKDEEMFLAIQATDSNLNTGETVNVFTIPEISGVKHIQEQIELSMEKAPTKEPEKEIKTSTFAPASTTAAANVYKVEKAEKVAAEVEAMKVKRADLKAKQEMASKQKAQNKEKEAKTREESGLKKKESNEKQMAAIKAARAKQETSNKDRKEVAESTKAEAQAERATQEKATKKKNGEEWSKKESKAKSDQVAREKAESDHKVQIAEVKTKKEIRREREHAEHASKHEAKQKATAVKREAAQKKEAEVKRQREEVLEAKKMEAETKQEAKQI